MNERVLVIDDDPDLLDLVTMVLEETGYRACTAQDGEQALRQIESGGMPDGILLDLKMPVMDGREFARLFRERYDAAAPIILVTAYESAARRATELGADDWLAKPFEVASLLAKIDAQVTAG